MFLCGECHDKANCKFPHGEFVDIELLVSWGKCEMCGKTEPCIDCHSYDFRTKKEEKADKMMNINLSVEEAKVILNILECYARDPETSPFLTKKDREIIVKVKKQTEEER